LSIDREVILDHWRRAVRALDTAKSNLTFDPDAAANRAYYSVFHAVSALFMLDDKTFKSHSGVEIAVHKDLVHEGRWPVELGDAYKDLHRLRMVGDYGSRAHVSKEQAREAIGLAEKIITAVHNENKEIFSMGK